VSELRGGIDPFDVDLLKSSTFGVGDKRLTKGEDTLLGSDTATFQHNEVVLHFTVMWETSHWSDRFVSEIGLSSGVVLDELTTVLVDTFTDSVNLLVDLSTMMVTLLT